MTRLSRYLTTARQAALLAPLFIGPALIITLVVMPRLVYAQTTATPAPTTSSDQSAPLTASPQPTTEIVDNPYGLDSLWRQGDYVARGTLIVLLIMSIGSWYIIVS
jgi:biopolymer transport protein ExbB